MKDTSARKSVDSPTTRYFGDSIGWLVGSPIVLLLLIVVTWNPGYGVHLLIFLGIYLLLSYSLNLVTGFGGLIVFCHAAFYGLGAYLYSLTRLRSGNGIARADALYWTGDWSYVSGVLAASFGAASCAWAIGFVSLRFRRDHFIFATIGFQMMIFTILYGWGKMTGGPIGIQSVPGPSIFGLTARNPWHHLLVVVGLVSIVLPLLFQLYRSPFGLALTTMREDERAAQAMGVDTNRLAMTAMVIAGGVAGTAGALYAGYVSYIDPTSFSLRESIFFVTLLMLGGSGNIIGPAIGAAVMLLLPELLRLFGFPPSVAANTREIIYGLVLIALMYWRPQGLVGAARGRV